MSTLRELKSRIGSVASSEKITGAMKMISSAKMHKAEGVLRRLEPFRASIQGIIDTLLSSDSPVTSPLAQAHADVRKVALVLFGSDDGLCGAYNVNIVKGLMEQLPQLHAEYGEDCEIEVLAVGKKMLKACGRLANMSVNVVAAPEVNSKSDAEAIKTFAKWLEQRFLSGDVDAVQLVYMHYYSAGRQRFELAPYLPATAGKSDGATERPCLFEPSATGIFTVALPMFLLSLLQEAFAQNAASEQAARVMAMQSANDNAQKLLEQLQLEYNKLRQQSITTELLDIVGGQSRD